MELRKGPKQGTDVKKDPALNNVGFGTGATPEVARREQVAAPEDGAKVSDAMAAMRERTVHEERPRSTQNAGGELYRIRINDFHSAGHSGVAQRMSFDCSPCWLLAFVGASRRLFLDRVVDVKSGPAARSCFRVIE